WVFATEEQMLPYRQDYYSRILTQEAYDCFVNGCRLFTQWIYFPMDDALMIDSVFYVRVTELYYDYSDNLCATIYIANDTDSYRTLSSVENLVIVSGDKVLASVGSDLGLQVPPHEATVVTLSIPPEYQSGLGYNGMNVAEFTFGWQ
nr:hypothetical protein [Lachnospiraceae bacterium]